MPTPEEWFDLANSTEELREQLQRSSEDIAETFIRRFCAWCEKEWAMKETDISKANNITPEYIRGYNAALESLPVAFRCCFKD
jgi:hypothetical protein